MNNKLLKYMLIVGVSIIWGIIIYKVVTGTGESTASARIVKEITTPVEYIKKEAFYLFADYPDPFLEEDENADTLNSPRPVIPSIASEKLVPKTMTPDFSFIQYHGMITHADKKTKIGLVSFRGQELLIKEKDKKEDIIFKKIEKDQLTILSKGQSRKILKQESVRGTSPGVAYPINREFAVPIAN